MSDVKWHWEQGVKYAVETIKTTLLLNGAAAIVGFNGISHRNRFTGAVCSVVECWLNSD